MKMKLKSIQLSLAIAGALALQFSACKDQKDGNSIADSPETAEPVSDSPEGVRFKDEKTGQVYENYLQLKDALVASDRKAAQSAATTLLANLGKDDPMELKSEVQALAEASDIEEQRKMFSTLGAKLEPILRDHLSSGTVYKQFCPMAFNNQGGYWFSDSKDIRNPYFGDAMLTCGKVEEQLSQL